MIANGFSAALIGVAAIDKAKAPDNAKAMVLFDVFIIYFLLKIKLNNYLSNNMCDEVLTTLYTIESSLDSIELAIRFLVSDGNRIFGLFSIDCDRRLSALRMVFSGGLKRLQYLKLQM